MRDIIPYYMLMLDKVRSMASEFDILHFHIDQFHFPIFHEMARRTVTTLHGRQDLPDLHHLYRGFPDMPLVSISNAQRAPIPDANYVGTVYHGLPRDLTPTLDPRGGYLAFLGRISPEKRVDRAIAIARAAGLPLKIAAKVDRVDEAYFRSEIEPLLQAAQASTTSARSTIAARAAFLGEARALLFPIDWPEPFGLAMIEAMACGTPVLAFRNGAVSEVIDEGVTGHVVDSMDEAICHAWGVLALDRGRVRQRFEERFTGQRMAQDYVKIYERLIGDPERRDEDIASSTRAARTNGNGALNAG